MEKLAQRLIPGIFALGIGFVFTIFWRNVFEAILTSHNRFWKGIVGLQNEVGKFGELFLKAIILLLGIALIATGCLLIYQYFTK